MSKFEHALLNEWGLSCMVLAPKLLRYGWIGKEFRSIRWDVIYFTQQFSLQLQYKTSINVVHKNVEKIIKVFKVTYNNI